jgi:hypothetical protein
MRNMIVCENVFQRDFLYNNYFPINIGDKLTTVLTKFETVNKNRLEYYTTKGCVFIPFDIFIKENDFIDKFEQFKKLKLN